MQAEVAQKEREVTSLVDRAYAWIKHQILTDVLPAGEIIDDSAIAQRLGVSRTPVRDAIRLLHAQGYLEVLPRKATRVAFLRVSDMRHVYQLITALEVEAVALIAGQRLGETGLAPLREAVAAMREVDAAAGQLADWHSADERFHRGLLQLCGNPWIARVGLEHRDFVQRAHLVALRLRNVTSTSTAVHAELVDLLAAGDVAAATANHLAQRNRMENDLIGAVERAGLKAL
ncbi:MAG TPA: GntR family transcriptional regulator [Geminicoccus sp.]|uniref:GntR family transcriptional regulator n=1 Tax=Geminicoccus sp. TaxID=2024832 RepID=UPI002B937185|nr:GntR family transcriptional regulator [Geminicoccus sp.]HWL71364.1 GntR family transcriptional regulator [Geminicoccus sp.]